MFDQLINKVKRYALTSFIIPLITINLCMLIYMVLGQIQTYPQFDWSVEKKTYNLEEYNKKIEDRKSYNFINCPENNFNFFYVYSDNQLYKIGSAGIADEKPSTSLSIKEVVMVKSEIQNNVCVKNKPLLYFIFNNFSYIEKIFIKSYNENTEIGFSKIKNPYIYGEVSISRTARYFPSIYIFKIFIILCSIILFFYWNNNLRLFNEFKKKNILNNFSNKFYYLGVLSCIFLFLHASFLGLNIDSGLFKTARKLIIILFILLEVCAQISLTKNLYKFRFNLQKFINPLILKIKIVFVSTVLIGTIISFAILTFGNPSSVFKHVLEWNYFSFLLFYYLLSKLIWKSYKP